MKLFNRQKKREVNLYSYYDHAGIVRHLEDMARRGWQLEKAGSIFWHYRRCAPAELCIFEIAMPAPLRYNTKKRRYGFSIELDFRFCKAFHRKA